MAAYFAQFKPLFGKLQENLYYKAIGFVRHASKSGTEVVATKDHGRPTRFGFKKQHGTVVKSGTVLHKHNRLIFAPGLNVGLGKAAKLYAKTPGTVIVSFERANLNQEKGIVRRKYPTYLPKYEKYINIIPEPQHRRFVYLESFYNNFQVKMATQLPLSSRTQGDGMEKTENECPREQLVVLQPQELRVSALKNVIVDKSRRNLGFVIQLTPKTINKRKKSILSNLKNKEPKFVPYEPYKAAVNPIIPETKKTFFKSGIKKKKDLSSLFSTNKSENKITEKEEVNKSKEGTEILDVDWKGKYNALESEIQTLREENQQLENQLKFQVQVNGELKNLLVAAVGEDMETKVHVLTEDKLHLAQALLKSAESLTTHQEQTEWLAGQCEVWRSKFLASSVMVEELARWKASLSQKVNEAHDALRKLLEDRRLIQNHIIKTHMNLCLLRDNFDLHSRKYNSKDSNIIDICTENLKLTEVLLLELLGSEKKSCSSQSSGLNHLEKTNAEKLAENVLSNLSILQLIGEPDAACNAVVGAAVNLSGQLYLQNHPPKIECCNHCRGEIKLI